MLKQSIVAVAGIVAISSYVGYRQTEPLDFNGLKSMVDNMGYTTKWLNQEAGKEKIEIATKNASFNVPVGAEVAASTHYIWLTVNLGPPPKSVDKHTELLKQNSAVQPDFFYITSKGNLMLAVPVDNRAVSPAVLKRVLEKLSGDVEKTAPYWQEK